MKTQRKKLNTKPPKRSLVFAIEMTGKPLSPLVQFDHNGVIFVMREKYLRELWEAIGRSVFLLNLKKMDEVRKRRAQKKRRAKR